MSMSHSFSIQNVQPFNAENVLVTAGIKDMRFLDGYPSLQNGEWPEGLTYVYQDRVSVRTTEVEYDGQCFKVRIFAASSPEDYRFAVKLIEAVAQLSNAEITPEDNEPMHIPQFREQYGVDWIKQHCKNCLAAVLGPHIKDKNAVGYINGVGARMTIGDRILTQLTQDKSTIAREFFSRLKRLNYIDHEDIFQASIMVLANESGDKNVRVSTYTKTVPTLFVEKNTVVALNSKVLGEELELDPGSPKDSIDISLLKLAELLGDKAVWLSQELLLVPGLEGEDWDNLIQKAKPFAIKDIFEYGYDPTNDPFAEKTNVKSEQQFTSEDIEILAYTPIIAFFMVAAADGDIDKKEVTAFQKQLVAGFETESDMFRLALLTVISRFEEMIGHVLSGQIDIQTHFQQLNELTTAKMSDQETLQFKVSLLTLAKAVAEASGGILGIFGSKISKSEQQALAALTVLLGLA